MNKATEFLNKTIVPALTALSENTYLSAIRAGMVSVVPLTIIGGLFMIVAFMPITWGSGKLSVGEIKDLLAFATKLKQPSTPLAAFISGGLSTESKQALVQFEPSGPVPSPLTPNLLKDLNAIIQGPCLHDEQRFSGVVLRDVTKQLLERKPQGKDLARLNRLLLVVTDTQIHPALCIYRQHQRRLILCRDDRVSRCLRQLDINPLGQQRRGHHENNQ